jgi:outer membrane immunogenic protein
MAVKAPPPPPSVPAFSWTGFYVGGNVGYGVAGNRTNYLSLESGSLLNNEFVKTAPNGVLGGGQLGYNWQVANWVAGLEADIQGASQSDSICVFQCATPAGGNAGTLIGGVEQKLDWFGTVRGRLGIAADRSLFYVTGGLAYGKVETDATQLFGIGAGANTGAANVSSTRAGSVLGGGIEAAISANWTAKVEYLYLDLGSQTFAFADTAGRTITVSSSFRDNVVRAGLNYKFGY